MRICVSLAGAETHTSVLDWFSMPILDLYDWAAAVNEVHKRIEKKTGKH